MVCLSKFLSYYVKLLTLPCMLRGTNSKDISCKYIQGLQRNSKCSNPRPPGVLVTRQIAIQQDNKPIYSKKFFILSVISDLSDFLFYL